MDVVVVARRLLPTPVQVIEASRKFLDTSILGYTMSSGMMPLRERISQVNQSVWFCCKGGGGVRSGRGGGEVPQWMSTRKVPEIQTDATIERFSLGNSRGLQPVMIFETLLKYMGIAIVFILK